MSGRRRVTADIEELCHAYDDHSFDHRYYLDLETGEVVHIDDEFMPVEEREELDEMVEAGYGERFISVDRTDAREGYRDMEDFVATVEEPALRDLLTVAIDGPGAFRRFGNVLRHHPEERERWFALKDGRTRERVLGWLEAEGIELADRGEREDRAATGEVD